MKTTITVRDIDPADKSWLRHEAARLGISMEEFVRRIIRERRRKAGSHVKPSQVFRRHFGPEHGVELPPRGRFGYVPTLFDPDDEA